MQLEDCKQFRQWESKTPGHPENFETEGIEVTTGLIFSYLVFDTLHRCFAPVSVFERVCEPTCRSSWSGNCKRRRTRCCGSPFGSTIQQGRTHSCRPLHVRTSFTVHFSVVLGRNHTQPQDTDTDQAIASHTVLLLGQQQT